MAVKSIYSGTDNHSEELRYRATFYERYAALKERSTVDQVRRGNLLREPYLRRFVKEFFPQNRGVRIVDLGCGNGSLLLLLQRSGYRNVSGVEASPDQVDLARQLGLDCVSHGDLLRFLTECETDSCDVVVAFDVLEHFRKDEIVEVLLEIRRVLTPNGRLILHVPNAEGIFSARIYWSDLTHETAFTREGLRQLGAATGLRFVRFVEDKPVAHGIKSLIRRLLWTVVRTVFRLIYISETGDMGKGLVLSQNLVAVAIKK